MTPEKPEQIRQVTSDEFDAAKEAFENAEKYADAQTEALSENEARDWEKYADDKKFVLERVKIDGALLQYASENLQNDREVVLEAVKQAPYAFNWASTELRGDREIASVVVTRAPILITLVSSDLRNDPQFKSRIR